MTTTDRNRFDVSGRVALITGGSKGRGKAIATGLARAGATVIIASRHEDELVTAIADIVSGTDVNGFYVAADLSRRPETERVARSAIEIAGRVDILVNNAGTGAPQRIEQVDDVTWDRLVELNLRRWR